MYTCHLEKQEKERYLRRHSSNRFSWHFHQNDHTVSVHLIVVTDDPENVGQGKIDKKC